LKWAGGKRQLLPVLRQFYPAQFGRYWEPFLGSGAVFFDLYSRHALDNRGAMLIDHNPDLMACYRAVRDYPDDIIDELNRLARDHERRGASAYYDVRSRFNTQRAALQRSTTGTSLTYSPALAGMFIYLNRTGYNGLFRLNASGEFNVPAGRYAKPRICDEQNLRCVSAALRRSGVTLEQQPFETVVHSARQGDFLYFDPPYAPLSNTARFTNYTADGFALEDQKRLREVLITLAKRGCRVVMSNSTAPEIAALYEDDREAGSAGLRCHRVPARRAINSKASARGAVTEFIITNVS
jgi:DNA adenine methylase